MLPEFHKARLSAVFCALGLIFRLLSAHPELWDSTWLMLTTKAFGTGLMAAGFLCMITYLIEGVLAMHRVKIEVKKATEKKTQKQ